MARSVEYLESLVRELSKLSTEVEWVEFKCNNKDPERIAKYISGLSNAATLAEKTKAYLVWGIQDDTHEIVGTDFEYRKMKRGNEELEAWLARMINPKINFRFYEVQMGADQDKNAIYVTLIEIPAAETEPTRFEKTAYIRVGTNLKPMVDYKEKEAQLWALFNTTPYELRIAFSNGSEEDITSLLDYTKYYDKLEFPIPGNREKVLEDFKKEKFIKLNDAGRWDITNYGALMFAKDLKKFEGLLRRGVRVIQYHDTTRVAGIDEQAFDLGYAISFEDIVKYIMTIIPHEEIMEDGIRKKKTAYPEVAIRELLANVMIHQALDQKGTSPMVELFTNRIEFSNAGAPLVAIDRIVDTVPVSRNENIAGFMHRCGICEERGSGYDKIVGITGKYNLLAPRIENQNNQFTKVVMFAKVPFDLTTKEDRIRTCYMHACLAYVSFGTIGNMDVRALFGLDEKEKTKASRIIKDTLDAGLIKPVDPMTAPRYMKYIPHWA